jgi:polysaccharide biosynthesis protein PslH
VTIDRVVLLAPIVPACTGNGLAMRAGMFLEALASQVDVDLVVVPVSGAPTSLDWAAAQARSVQVVEPVTGAAAREHVTAQLADPRLRARLEATAPLPTRTMLAPPTLAAGLRCVLERGPRPPTAVAVLRGYLAPLGAALASQTGAARLVIDLDDDDEPLLREFGDDTEADALRRLFRAWLPDADAVLTASPGEADAISQRYGVDHVIAVPNSMRPVPNPTLPSTSAPRLLFVGNLTYRPNLEAASVLVEDVLPLVRRRRPDATVDLVGPVAPARLDHLAAVSGVTVAGLVPDVSPWYAQAAVVVVPLRHGAGTRLKVLEAFAQHRPVVATPVAVAGLDVEDGREVLLAETPAGLAGAVTDLLEAPDLGVALTRSAAVTLAGRYVPSAVYPTVRQAVLGRAIPPGQPVGSAGGAEAA